MSGYSLTPLIKKLGIKSGFRMLVQGAPGHYFDLLGPLPEGVEVVWNGKNLPFIHLFVRRRMQLEAALMGCKAKLAKDGMLWISWPKGSSSFKTDLNREFVRSLGLAAGLVDVKVCAIDQDWSGLKFVYRQEDR